MIDGIKKLNLEKANNKETVINVSIGEDYVTEINDTNGNITIKVMESEQGGKDPITRILQGKKIAIDPGHGGTSSGAVGPSGVREKDLVLSTSFKIRDILTQLGAEVILTRTRDNNVTLAERVRLANNGRADLFVSVHYNGFNNPSANGTETYWHTNGSAQSRRLARLLQQQLLAKLNRRNRGVKQANFYVLRETNMPAALIEPLFITNPDEERIIRNPANQQKVAQAVVDAIINFYS